MRVALITPDFDPEPSASARRATDLTSALNQAGHETVVLTGHSCVEGQVPSHGLLEQRPGTQIWRFGLPPVAKSNLRTRLLVEARFALRVSKLRTRLSGVDGVIASAPYMFNLCAARSYRLPMWADLRDATWEYAHDLLHNSAMSWCGSYLLKWLSLSNLRGTVGISTTAEGQRQYLINNGIKSDKIMVVPNGVSRQVFEWLGHFSNADRNDGPIRVVYAGSIGFVQGMAFLVESIADLDASRIELHVYGDGADRAALMKYCQNRRSKHIHFYGKVPYEDYIQAITCSDILIISQRPVKSLAGTTPAKMWECMAAGRPILYVGGQGEASRLIEGVGAGFRVSYGDQQDFYSKLNRLMDNDACRLECGRNGRDWVGRYRIREQINANWVQAMETAFDCDAPAVGVAASVDAC